MNPFSFEMLNGTKEDGEHVLHNGFTAEVWRKILVEDGVVIRAWEVEGNRWARLTKQHDGYWTIN